MPLKKPISLESTFASYSAVEIIGQGGTGTVYRATTDDGAKVVAIKILDPDKATTERRKRFKNELQFGMNARHPNVIAVSDHGTVTHKGKPTLFYVMPLYPRSLRDAIRSKVSHDSVVRTFAQILDGVEAAHLQSVTHRDLKPENILSDGEGNLWVIADFGIAEFSADELYTLVETEPHTRLANFQYAAPEQRERNGRTDARTDIFALGLILNEMFTGTVAHGVGYRTINDIAPEYSYLDELVASMIQQQASARPLSIEVIKRELIGRKNAFVERQKVSELRNAVVPTAEIDDRIARDPIRLVHFDWDGTKLTLKLNQVVNGEWVQAIQFGSYGRGAILGKGPERFNFLGDRAEISARDNEVQSLIDHFKSWLPHANQIYIERLTAKIRDDEKRQREAMQREVELRDRRRALLENVKI